MRGEGGILSEEGRNMYSCLHIALTAIALPGLTGSQGCNLEPAVLCGSQTGRRALPRSGPMSSMSVIICLRKLISNITRTAMPTTILPRLAVADINIPDDDVNASWRFMGQRFVLLT